ncbi:MAG: DUF4843 domain-containing protein [Rikenellaceae bacterium]
MKKISILAFVAAASVFAVGCSESELGMFDTNYNYVQFSAEDEDDEVEESVSFSLLAGAEETIHYIDVEILGVAFDTDTEYKVSVVSDESTAVAGLHYEALSETYTFPAGVYEATLPIKFYSTAEMDDDMFYLQLQIEAYGNVKPGLNTNVSTTIAVTNQLVQPSWWPSYTYVGTICNFLGGYTVAKWENFIAALTEAGYYVPDMDFSSFTYGDWYDTCLIFSQYLDEYEPVDSSGNLVTIPFPY